MSSHSSTHRLHIPLRLNTPYTRHGFFTRWCHQDCTPLGDIAPERRRSQGWLDYPCEGPRQGGCTRQIVNIREHRRQECLCTSCLCSFNALSKFAHKILSIYLRSESPERSRGRAANRCPSTSKHMTSSSREAWITSTSSWSTMSLSRSELNGRGTRSRTH